MVWLVKVLVYKRMVKSAVDEVDKEVGEENEYGELEPIVGCKGGLVEAIVEFGVATHLGEKEGYGQNGHDGHGNVRLLHFEPNLVLEIFRVFEGVFVEDEQIGRAGNEKVDKDAEDPADDQRWLSDLLLYAYHVINPRLNACR